MGINVEGLNGLSLHGHDSSTSGAPIPCSRGNYSTSLRSRRTHSPRFVVLVGFLTSQEFGVS
jgi:hypothetical protein